MDESDIERVRQEFASGEALELRLRTGHTLDDCAAAAGVSGVSWWRYENGEQSITAQRAPFVARVLERMRLGERLETGGSADAIDVLPLGDGAIAERARRERDNLGAAEDFLSLSAVEMAGQAPEWDSPTMLEVRAAARRVLRKRIDALGIEPPRTE